MLAFKRSEAAYLTGRAAALLSKPAYLLICNRLFGNGVAAILASVFLVSAMLTALSAIDSYRVFYARYFGSEPGAAGRPYTRYVFSMLIVGLIGFGCCFAYFLATEGSIALAAVSGLFFLSEKLADEVLRYTLFQRARASWGLLMAARVSCQVGLIGLVALTRPAGTVAGALFVLALLGGNIVAFGRKLPLVLLVRCLKRPALIGPYLSAGAKLIFRSGLIWVLSLATTFGGYLERLIVLCSRKDDLAAFSLIVTSLSVVQTAVEYFYFSQRRRDFLQGSIRYRDVVTSRGFWVVLVSSLGFGFALSFVNIKLYHGAPYFPLFAVVAVAVMQVTLATTSIVREIVYWNNQLRALLRVELLFFAMVIAIFSVLYFEKLSYVWLLLPAAGALLIRLFLFARIKHDRVPISH